MSLPTSGSPSGTTAFSTPAVGVSAQPAQVQDGRRYARRDCKLRAHVTIMASLDPTFATVREFDVTVRNVSRCGACFLFFSQLYPDDRITLDFGELARPYRVARVRRVQKDCFEIGVAVVSR